jgi:hypothetical protein
VSGIEIVFVWDVAHQHHFNDTIELSLQWMATGLDWLLGSQLDVL